MTAARNRSRSAAASAKYFLRESDRGLALALADFRLAAAQGFHHAANDGAVAFVKRHQQRKALILGRLRDGADQLIRELRSTETIEIHRKERDLGCEVAGAQPLAEFHAIEDRDFAVLDADVLAAQVAMTLAHAAGHPLAR